MILIFDNYGAPFIIGRLITCRIITHGLHVIPVLLIPAEWLMGGLMDVFRG